MNGTRLAIALAAGVTAIAAAAGPDVSVSGVGSGMDPEDFVYLGADSDIHAYIGAIGTCNLGDAPAETLNGHAGTNIGRHPVAVQNLYRLLDGRFEQIGMSWAFHYFCTVNGTGCGTCNPTSCGTLGDGCRDSVPSAYPATLETLGRRADIDPWPDPGVPSHTELNEPDGPPLISGQLQVAAADLLAGGLQFYEILLVTHDEPASHRYNNASWRPMTVTTSSIEAAGDTVEEQTVLNAWKLHEPDVGIKTVDVPGDGRMHVGFIARDNGDGTWDYEYAVYNMNSARAGASFAVPRPTGVAITDVGFHDVDYHSGDGIGGVNQDGTDWTAAIGPDAVTWATQPVTENANANALRWGTLYNFRFTADIAPAPASITIGLFHPGTPDAVAVTVIGPGPPACPADTNGDGTVDVNDLVNVFLDWSTDGTAHNADVDGSGVVDVNDVVELITTWGACGS